MSTTPTIGRKLRVAVLMGGNSSERAVSLSTGKMILASLAPHRYDAFGIDTREAMALLTAPVPQIESGPATGGTGSLVPEPERNGAISPDERNERGRPDVVFLALHGKGGEDGTIQGMLEMLGLPYTGSGVLASALAMDKGMTKRVFREAGLPVIPDVVFRRDTPLSAAEQIALVQERLGFPVFVKPNAEGSTFGCTLVQTPDALPEAVTLALKYDALVLVETYIQGMEVTVGVLDNPLEVLPPIEIVPKSVFYDYESKYADGGSEHIIPARLPEARLAQVQELALQAHTVLGCRGMSRTDFLLMDEAIYLLETNTIPGMTPTSLLPQAAAVAGIPFPALLDRLIENALNKDS